MKNRVGTSRQSRRLHCTKQGSVSTPFHNLLVEKKMVDSKKVKAWQPKKKEGAPADAAAATAETPAAATDAAPAAEAALTQQAS